MQDFKNTVKELTDWWDSGQGTTCEFSTSLDNIEEKMLYLSKINPSKGRWLVQFCDTCHHYDVSKPLHVMIWPTSL